jgi:hypothetical protein
MQSWASHAEAQNYCRVSSSVAKKNSERFGYVSCVVGPLEGVGYWILVNTGLDGVTSHLDVKIGKF